MKRFKARFHFLITMITIFMLMIATGPPPALAQQPTATAYTAFDSAFAAPYLSGVGATTLTYSAGNLYQGGLVKPIVAGTIGSLDASRTDCSAPAYATCEFVYWTSSTALLKTTSFTTAYGAGANIIVAYLTTSAGSAILTITPASLMLPSSASAPLMFSCGASLAAAGACANTTLQGAVHFITGSALLSGSTSTITGISPAFTSATSWWCVANDITTRANPVQAVPGSGTTLVITNTTGATDLIQFMCMGN